MSAPSRKLRMALAGGGPGSFIGPVHRMAAELDGRIALVAGAFSKDPARSAQAGREYGIAPDRAYSSFEEMFARERRREDPIDFVAIATPNHLHLPVARAAMEAGFDVLSDKPATATLAEALELRAIVRRTGRLYGLTFTYSGYPLVRQARELCRAGALGDIRKVVAEYSQGWLSTRLETTGQKQAGWRADPAQSGIGGCIGDIGVHAFHTLEFVSGRRVSALCAELSILVEGRALDDDCNVLLRLDNGAPGVLFASQIAAGERNGLRLRVYGEKGGLDWRQEDPNQLILNWLDRPTEILHAGASYLSGAARAATRLPGGHPEGFIEAFANLYRDFAAGVFARLQDPSAEPPVTPPGIEDAVRTMAFMDSAVRGSREHAWISLAAPS